MKRLRCEKCEITASDSWAFMWHAKTFTVSPAGSKQRTRQLWLCPDCAGEFASDRARDAVLQKTLDGTER